MRPRKPPVSESARLSVSSWRMIWKRPAPSAARVASSRFLAEARTSRRLATLAQAMRRTRPTAPSRTSRGCRVSPTIDSCRDAHCEAILWAESAGIFAAELVDGEFQLRVGLLQGHAGLEARGDGEVMGHVLRGEIELEGKPEITWRFGHEPFSDDSDDEIGQRRRSGSSGQRRRIALRNASSTSRS